MARVRLRAFRRVIGPVLYYYQESNRLILIDGEGDFDEVSAAIVEAVETVQRQEARSATTEETRQIETAAEIVTPLSPAEATHQSFDLVLVGGPGSGKGTQAEQLKNYLELPHIASGDLFRENLKNQTELGKLAKTYMDRGELVPDDVTEAMVEDRISRPDAAKGFILDGFPRTLPQAQALTEMLNQMRRRIDGVLYIRVSDEEIVKRLSGRLICRECQTPYHLTFKPPAKEGICDACGGDLYQRDDDNPKTVRARLKTFHDQTAPIINYYRDCGILFEVNGEGEVSSVKERTIDAVKELRKVAASV
jgi:adenylate kinase